MKYYGTLKELGYKFNTSGDTEVLLYSYLNWGCDFLEHVDGMYAVAVYDIEKNLLYLFRDRYGEKPIYYSLTNECLYFSSELKPLLQQPNFKKTLNEQSVSNYLAYGFVFGAKTLVDGICKVNNSSFVKLDLSSGTLQEFEYSTQSKHFCKKEYEKVNFDQLFSDVVESRLSADVPAGVLLSGGLDSSLVAVKAAQIQPNIQTFNIRFKDNVMSNDDANNAVIISKAIKSNHHEIIIDDMDVEQVNTILESFDEVINDPSIIPTYSIYKEVAKHCKVVLGGDGADEFFGGYRRYYKAAIIGGINNSVPNFLKVVCNSFTKFCIPKGISGRHFALMSFAENFDRAVSLPTLFEINEIQKLINSKFILSGYNEISKKNNDDKFLDLMMHFDQQYYLPNDILLKVDRCSMMNSIEARSPFLSPEIESFAKKLSSTAKVKGGYGKLFLREYGKSVLPKSYQFNAKNGFSPPFSKWFSVGNEMRQHAEKTLLSTSCRFDNQFVKELFNKLDGGYNLSRKLMALYFLEIWRSKNNISWF